MAKTKKGDRKAVLRVRIVEYGNRISLFFDDYDLGPINFNSTSGRSGPKAYEKLKKVLEMEDAKETTV